MGYHRAGFDVVGVDHVDQPNYPFEFRKGDALECLHAMLAGDFSHDLGAFEAIHASPPCQAYSTLNSVNRVEGYQDLVGSTRTLLESTGLPYVIENVVGAPLRDPIMLCGSSFGLRIRRHRLFEANVSIMALPCAHHWQQDRIFPALDAVGRKKGGRSGIVGVYGHGGDKRADLWPQEMGIDWMSRQELTQAIPPAMTEHIGSYLLSHIDSGTKGCRVNTPPTHREGAK